VRLADSHDQVLDAANPVASSIDEGTPYHARQVKN
jgi:hypothetical protein